MDIERKCEFNRVTPKEIITYKFTATINDKKARDKLFKGPLELRTVLETIELDHYNREYGDKKNRKVKSRGGFTPTAPLAENKSPSLDLHGSEGRWTPTRRNRLELLTEPNQEIQLDFAGPIKSKIRGDVYILVAVDRFSKWPTAQICKNTDTRTVINFQHNFAQTTERHGPSEPITVAVLKAIALKISAPAKI